MIKFAVLLGLSLLACAPKGHASIFRCYEGRVVDMEVPLSRVDEVEDFEDCGEGTCVPKGQACPKPAAKPAARATAPAEPAGSAEPGRD